MNRVRAVLLSVGLGVAVVSVSGCLGLAPAPAPVSGAVGVTVDETGGPVLVVEACEESAARVELSWTREGLADDQQNQAIGVYAATAPRAGTSRLALGDPGAEWDGEPFDLDGDTRGVIAGGSTTAGHTLRDVVFLESDLAELTPGAVRWAQGVSEQGTVISSTLPEEEFSAAVCGPVDG
ncbi:hypothetical protein [Ornithinimicrobium tianjinense]|uniref:Uncharacterized protein n=1 Tax=Ornithinimicrobium tianjinense TaxID=1195761 RepID=A0A917BIU0_9MICO|nr:hypothetical protein [Ornithinimicrobium tianjinense]GGF43589.1 hypothetical protein GCM10011366_09270 [Ornithinimicrobium tianjinense]